MSALGVAPARVGAAPTQVGNPNLAALNLDLKDIPTGFTSAAAWTKNDAQFAAGTNRTAAQLEKAGRLLTNASSFQRSAASGIFLIGSEIAYYKSAAAALADYHLDASHVTPPTGYTLQKVSVSKVGRFHVEYQLTGLSNGIPIAAESLIFQRGRYLAVIQISGLRSTYDPGDAYILARTVDARLSKQPN
jgi:hypothetical protein